MDFCMLPTLSVAPGLLVPAEDMKKKRLSQILKLVSVAIVVCLGLFLNAD